MTTTYQHGLGPRPLTVEEGIRLLRKVTEAYREVIDLIFEYDDEHPELWDSCSEHPDGSCGQRDMPLFMTVACVTTCDVSDAERFLEAWDAPSIDRQG